MNENDFNTILKYAKGDDLMKIYSRNITVQIAQNFVYKSILELKRLMGVNFSQLLVNTKEFSNVYSLKSDFEKLGVIIEKKINEAKSVKDYYENKALPIFEKYKLFTREMKLKYSARKTFKNAEILRDYLKFLDINASFIGVNFFIFISDAVFDRLIKEYLSKYLSGIGKNDELEKYLIIISNPLQKPAVMREHEELLKIFMIVNVIQKNKKINEHAIRWGWFPCYNPSDKPYNVSHYKKELKQYSKSEAKKELQNIFKEKKKHLSEYNKFLSSVREPKLKKLIPLVNAVCFYREHRNDIRREGLCDMEPFFKNLGRKFELSTKETCYLANQEIIDSLKKNKLQINKKAIKKRITNYILFYDLKRFVFLDSKQKITAINKILSAKNDNNKMIKGNPASGGFVKAKAYVITNIDKLKTFKEGDVLVASMTAPDYVQAMKKAAAIITDEGGITCHAAIVSRELKKPCIIGTKIATQVLKDGQLVEVDANKGIVRIIK